MLSLLWVRELVLETLREIEIETELDGIEGEMERDGCDRMRECEMENKPIRIYLRHLATHLAFMRTNGSWP